MSVTINSDWPSGFFPAVGPGGDSSFRCRRYTVLAAYTDEIPAGALVRLDSTTGGVQVYTGGAHNSEILGVAMHYVNGNAVAADQDIWVYDDPRQVFEGQFDDGTITTIAGLQGKVFDVVNNDVPNSVTKRSTGEIDAATAATASDGSNVAFVIGLSRAVDTALGAGTANQRVQFTIMPVAHVFNQSQ